MKKLSNKISIFIVFTLLCLINPIDVFAGDYRFSHSRVNSCVNDGSCVLMCGYTNEIYMTAASKDDWTVYSSYIYYSTTEDKFFVESHRSDQARVKYDWDSNAVFKSSYAKEKLSKGECPSNSYIENDGLSSEICFDNNSTENGWCKTSDPGGIGTKFRGTSKLEYDNMGQIDTWLNNWSYGNVNCLDLVGKDTATMETFISDKFDDDWENYVHEIKIDTSSFILELANSRKGKIAGDKKDEFVLRCTEEINNNSNLTDVEKQETTENLSKIDGDKIADQWTEKMETTDEEEGEDENPEYTGGRHCGIFGDETWKIIQSLYGIVKVIIPVLVVILGMIDFASVVFSGEDKDMKLAGQRFIKRIIIAVVLILLPPILRFVFNLVGFSEGCLAELWISL